MRRLIPAAIRPIKINTNDAGSGIAVSETPSIRPVPARSKSEASSVYETPSPLNPLGTKGVGEAGAIPVGALFAQAIEDALGPGGPEILEIPLSPDRLFALAGPLRGEGT